MSVVRFAITCDVNGCITRSDEYTSLPNCIVCGGHTCPQHQLPNSLVEGDGETHSTCVCVECEEVDLTEEGE